MNLNKLVLKGTGKISLHDRFTQLSKIQVNPKTSDWGDHEDGYSEPMGNGVSRYGRGASEGVLRRPKAAFASNGYSKYAPQPRQPSPTIIRPAPRPTSMPHMSQQYRERSVDRERLLYRPSAAVSAARNLKRKSIQQRLGVKARLTMPVYRPGAGLQSNNRLLGGARRWGSTESVNSNNVVRRRWNNFGRRGGYFNRGIRRWQGFKMRNNRRGQGWRGRGGGRWRRGGRNQGPPPSKEQLDKELDSYMSGTKAFLDRQLDDYMMEAAQNA